MTQMTLRFCFIAALFVASALSERIAFVAIEPHVKDFLPAAVQLATMGHSVTVASYSHDGEKETNLAARCTAAHANLTFTDVGVLPADLNVTFHSAIVFDPNTPPTVAFPELTRWWGGVNGRLAEALVAEWRAGSPARPDYIVVEMMSFGGIDVADALGIPYGIFSFFRAASTSDMIGTHYGQPVWVAMMDLAFQQSRHMSWASRIGFGLTKPILSRMAPAYVGWYGRNPVRAALGLPPVRLWSEAVPLRDGAQPLVVVSRVPGLDAAIPLPPNWLRVASLNIPKATPPPLDGATAAWFDGFAGMVVVACGRFTILSGTAKHAIAGAAALLAEHGIGVYWGLRDRTGLPAALPANLRIEEWIAQRSALGHPKTTVFVTHGGASSLEEGVVAGLPLLVLGGGGDQKLNGMIVQDAELGLAADRNGIGAVELATRVLRLHREPQFRDRAALLQGLARQEDGVEAAAAGIERAVRFGTRHLTPAVDGMHWVLRNDYDVLAVALLLGYGALHVAWSAISRCCAPRRRAPQKGRGRATPPASADELTSRPKIFELSAGAAPDGAMDARAHSPSSPIDPVKPKSQ